MNNKFLLFLFFSMACILSACNESMGTMDSVSCFEDVTATENTENIYNLYINESIVNLEFDEHDFIRKIKNNLDNNYMLYDFICDDFDKNGKSELFAILQSEENKYDFSLWFVSELECVKLDKDTKYNNVAYTFETLPDETPIVLATDMLNTRIVTPVYCFYFVKDGILNEYTGDDFKRMYGDVCKLNFHNNHFYAEDNSAYDVDNSRWGTIYRIDWTGTEFKDISAKEITIDELTFMDDNNIINLPENITKIYMRSDGTININYVKEKYERSISYYEKNGVIISEITKSFFINSMDYNGGYYINDYPVKISILSKNNDDYLNN